MKFISEKAGSKALPTKVIAYVQDDIKVCRDENGQTLMATIGLDDSLPYDRQFRETAMLTGNYYRESDRKYYHFKYTCSPDDYDPDREHNNITPDQLLEEAITLCNEKLTGYQALIVVQYHNNGLTGRDQNRAHLHAHIIMNASPYDSSLKRLRLSNKDLDHLRDYAYEAGCKYQLHEGYWRDESAAKRQRKEALLISADPMQETGTEGICLTEGELGILEKHGASFAEKSFKERYRIAIDEARKEVTTLPMFQAYLKKHFSIKVEVTQQGNIKFKFPDRTTYTSGHKLGNQYTLDAIMGSLNESKALHMDDLTSLAEEVSMDTYEGHAGLSIVDPQAVVWRTKILNSLDSFLQWKKEETASRKMHSELDCLNNTVSIQQLILEQTTSFYELCAEAAKNEELYDALTEEEKQKILQLQHYREWLAAQEEKEQKRGRELELRHLLTHKSSAVSSPRITRYAEDGRERSLLEIMVLIAVQTVEDLKGFDEQEINYYCRGKIQTDQQAQKIMNSIQIARELGARTLSELELLVDEEGQKFRKIKREYHKAKLEFIESTAALTAAVKQNESLSDADKKAEIAKIQLQLYEKMEQLDTSFSSAKKHYSQCAAALDTIQTQQARQTGYPLQSLPQGHIVEEPEARKSQRSAAEAKKIAQQQMQEIRSWVDASIDIIAQTPSAGSEKDLEEWKREMERYGCQIRITKNTISVKHPKSSQPIRLNRLGGDYEKERIIYGISIQKQQHAEQRRCSQEYKYPGEPRRTPESLDGKQAVETHARKYEPAEECAGTGERNLERSRESSHGSPTKHRRNGAFDERV